MSSFGHDYRSIVANRKRNHFWLFAAGLAVLVIVNVIALSRMRAPYSVLDRFQPLNSVPSVPERTSLDHGTVSDPAVINISSIEERAVVTTLYSDSYVNTVLALGYSLQAVQITARRILLYFPDRISSQTACQLQAVGWELHPIARIAPPDGGRGVFHRFLDNYSKLQLWTLDKIGIKTVVYLDGDMLVRKNFDELWVLPFEFAAVPDVYGNKRGFTMSFNAGMMFLRTSSAIFDDMVSKIGSEGYAHTEAEQGFLNLYFAAQVVRLPYIYNANLMVKQRSMALWQAIERDTRVIHYTMVKPFIKEERERARGGLWEAELELWETVWHDASKELEAQC